jgi:hypothetical protein
LKLKGQNSPAVIQTQKGRNASPFSKKERMDAQINK